MNTPEQDLQNQAIFINAVNKMRTFAESRIKTRDVLCRLTEVEVASILANLGTMLAMVRASNSQYQPVVELLEQLKTWRDNPKERLTLPQTLNHAIERLENAAGSGQTVGGEDQPTD